MFGANEMWKFRMTCRVFEWHVIGTVSRASPGGEAHRPLHLPSLVQLL